MGYGICNLLALLFGLTAWVLPLLGIWKNCRGEWVSTVSMALCALALSSHFFYVEHLVQIEDWSALMDTRSGSLLAVEVLLIGAVLVNVLAWLVRQEQRR